VSLFEALFGGRDPTKSKAGQRNPRHYKQDKPELESLPDDYEVEEMAAEGMNNSTNSTNSTIDAEDLQTPEVKLAARLGLAPERRVVSTHERAVMAHSRSDAHGAVFHAAFAAHRSLGHGGRELASDEFGLDASDELLWSLDHRGEETLISEGDLGAAVRAEHNEHITSVSLAASLASRAFPTRRQAAARAHGVLHVEDAEEDDDDVERGGAAAAAENHEEHWNALLAHPLKRDEHAKINVNGQVARSALGAAQDHDELSSLTRDLHMFQDGAASASTSLVAEACAPAAMHWSPLDAMVDAVCGRVTDTVSTSPESSEKSLYKLSKAREKSRQQVPAKKMSEMATSGRHATVAHAVAASLALRGGAAEATSAPRAPSTPVSTSPSPPPSAPPSPNLARAPPSPRRSLAATA
jgi:hypothetical protein